ncbi:DUF4124 domain-containing protein [Microbulbifer flavimaris]|uniref:DUF4124 domain-containing protein n=1 Tax=Microbulbifer flavimaris TaxID=1781068 RepID=A0ABX4HX28_9GAMM|nr:MULTISPECIES: DUF4124 domain-containing protein [Microbulbifer]KUJ79633.1 hypothetical protein AVO43_14845 [Microbulbifer sp. ZGT114]PCO04158.1 DUF4124 domain-containing protein [Microbulbifer flavimaris]
MRSALAMLATLTTLTLTLAAHADGIYKWVDENGVVHFGSQPPQKEKQVEVVRKPKSERYRQWESEQMATQAAVKSEAGSEDKAEQQAAEAAPNQQESEVKQLTKAEMAVRAQRCRLARTNLESLTTHSRVREIGTDGKQRVLPEEERQARIARAKQIIQENC